jgi:hypothetical protein
MGIVEREPPLTWDENGHMVPITDVHRRRWAESLIPPPPPDGPRLKKERRRLQLRQLDTVDGSSAIVPVVIAAVALDLTLMLITYWYFAVSAGLLLIAVHQTIRHRGVRK